MELHLIAIIPWIRTSHHGADRRLLDLADPLELIAQDFSLRIQLHFVWHMLIMAAAACSEVSAARFDPLRCSLQDFRQFSSCEALPFLSQPDAHAFTWQSKWHEDRSSVFQSSKCLAAVGEGSERKLAVFSVHLLETIVRNL
jgi:hypothetical protein